MTELREILENCLLNDSIMTITINCNIPKLTLRINDSRQMIFYGIGQDKQHGFTLNISIDKNSKIGKKLLEKLNDKCFLTDFIVFEDIKSMIYLKDFKQEVKCLESTINELLIKLNYNNSTQTYQLIANRTEGNYRLE